LRFGGRSNLKPQILNFIPHLRSSALIRGLIQFSLRLCASAVESFCQTGNGGEMSSTRPIRVRIKRAENAQDLPLPMRMTEHAAGFDLPAAVSESVTIQPGEIRLIPCGFSMAIPHGYEAQIRPRSGLASRFGITMINSPGTIDSDYRGEVQVPLINLGKALFVIERGMRIAQMLVTPVPTAEIEVVKDLDETQRGRGGFGHTGH
jgi:dUTP pyrophosphatase